MSARPTWVTWIGLAVVLAAAAVLSFDALRGLAEAVSIPPTLAWLLPVAVDAGGAVSCTVWLSPRSPADASRFAARMTWSLLTTTVLGNAGALGMHAEGVTPPWPVAVLVGAIAPAVVGSTVHLLVLLGRGPAPAVSPAQVTEDSCTEPAPAADPDEDSCTELHPAVPAPVLAAVPDDPPDPLLDKVLRTAQRAGRVPSRDEIRSAHRVGTARAADLRRAALEVTQ